MTVLQTMMIETGPHVVRVVKQSATAQSSPPAFEITDGELQAPLKANTLYEIRVGIRVSWTNATGQYWRLSPSVSVAHAVLASHTQRTNIGDAWLVATADPNTQFCWNTFQFNSDTRSTTSNNATNAIFGRIKTSAACTLRIKWGTTNTNPLTGTLLAGSWLYAREVEEI